MKNLFISVSLMIVKCVLTGFFSFFHHLRQLLLQSLVNFAKFEKYLRDGQVNDENQTKQPNIFLITT